MKQELIEKLVSDNHSLLIEQEHTIKVYDTHGIATLLQIVEHDPEVLRDATMVDKVVGKAAAALMILGGIKELHALLISKAALNLLNTTDIKVSYDEQVPFIENRNRNGWCPMEEACRNCQTAEECLHEIKNKLSEMRQKQ